jgi:hypothetical protein
MVGGLVTKFPVGEVLSSSTKSSTVQKVTHCHCLVWDCVQGKRCPLCCISLRISSSIRRDFHVFTKENSTANGSSHRLHGPPLPVFSAQKLRELWVHCAPALTCCKHWLEAGAALGEANKEPWMTTYPFPLWGEGYTDCYGITEIVIEEHCHRLLTAAMNFSCKLFLTYPSGILELITVVLQFPSSTMVTKSLTESRIYCGPSGSWKAPKGAFTCLYTQLNF